MNLRESKLIRALMCASMLVSISPLPLLAQEAPKAAPAVASPDVSTTLQKARESIKGGQYDQAIETLQGVIGQPQQRTETLRDAYLLLIKAFIYQGNDLKGKDQRRQQALLDYEKARGLIAECLRVPELRHTQPEPEPESPGEMIQFFKDVRAQIFGSFRVSELSPEGAVVLFDADTLRNEPGSSTHGDIDLAVGRHMVVVRYPGFRDVTEEVAIAPGSTLERQYQLSRPGHRMWYASGAAVLLGGGLAAILGRKSSGTAAPQPLDGPPPPPTRPQ
jgi:hypothetical protein